MSRDTLIPLSIVFTLLGAAMSYGMIYNKVDATQELLVLERQERKEDVEDLKQQIAQLNDAVLRSLGEKKDLSLNTK